MTERIFGIILERDIDGTPTKGHAPKPLEEHEMLPHPRPEVVIGEIDSTPTTLKETN